MTFGDGKQHNFGRPPHARAKLDALGTDEFCSMVVNGKTFEEIAEIVGVDRMSINQWVGLEEGRRVKIYEARKATSIYHEEAALTVMLKAIPTMADVNLARETAKVHMWLAKIRDPDNAGDRSIQEVTAGISIRKIISDTPQTEDDWLAEHAGKPNDPG